MMGTECDPPPEALETPTPPVTAPSAPKGPRMLGHEPSPGDA